MHQDVVILLEVQTQDAEIFGLEDRLAALAPRLAALEADTQRAERALAEVQTSIESEERRQRDVQFRIDQHRDLLARHEQVLNTVTSPREAAAAVAQTEQARRMLSDDEREMASIHSRIVDLRAYAAERGREVDATRGAQAGARETLAADRRANRDGPGRRAVHAERKRRPGVALAALAIRQDPAPRAGGGPVRPARPVVRPLRHDHSDAAPQRDGGIGRAGGLRRLWSAPVRGRMMLAGWAAERSFRA